MKARFNITEWQNKDSEKLEQAHPAWIPEDFEEPDLRDKINEFIQKEVCSAVRCFLGDKRYQGGALPPSIFSNWDPKSGWVVAFQAGEPLDHLTTGTSLSEILSEAIMYAVIDLQGDAAGNAKAFGEDKLAESRAALRLILTDALDTLRRCEDDDEFLEQFLRERHEIA